MISVIGANVGRTIIKAFTDAFSEVFSTFTTLFQEVLWNPQGAVLLGVLLFLYLNRKQRRPKLTTARWVGLAEQLAAIRRAHQQFHSRKINDVVLWCGTAPKWQTWGGMPQLLTRLTGHPPVVYLPDANQSIVVAGRPKSGKTYSAINPMLVSAIEQGMAIALYDYKADAEGNGGQMSYLAPLAVRQGYKVGIFAPGRRYSCIINPLDFLEDEKDDAAAFTLAEVFHSNLLQGVDKGDVFFGPAGQRLMQGAFQFAKATPYPDLAMAFSLLQLPQLSLRLHYAAEQETLPYFVQVVFAQLISTLESEKTTASIISTAANVVNRFISPQLLPSLMGKTNISTLLDAREMIIFQSDIFRQDAINPILAAIIHLMMQKNLSIQRQVPLVFSADEFPTLYLPKAPTWANEHRSKGYVGIYGYQSMPQLADAYGRDKTGILLAGIGTHFWFNPNHYETAKEFESRLGEQEIWLNKHSRSRQSGEWKQGRTVNEEVHLRSLMAADQLNRFRQGECILTNPGYESKEQASLPWHIRRVQISSIDRRREQECERIWNERLRERIIQFESQQRSPIDLEEQLKLRQQEAEKRLPMPPDDYLKKTKKVPGGIKSPDF